MGAKQQVVTIKAEGDDFGKVFVITKMRAEPLEDWGARLFLGLARAKIEIPADIQDTGIVGIVRYGFSGAFSQLQIEDLRPLLAEMMSCVAIMPDVANPDFTRPLFPTDIEEVKTRLTLRKAWIELHTGFSIPDVSLTKMSGQKKPGQESS